MLGSKKLKILLGKLDEPLTTVKNVPDYPGWLAFFGPGMVLAAMGLGSGELIWWPYMVGKYGPFYLGWYLIMFFLPLFIQIEIGRYTLATGESVYEGFHRIHHLLGWFMFIAILIIGSWTGGYISGGATGLAALTNFPPGWGAREQTIFWSLVGIWLMFLMVLLGPVAYSVIEIVATISGVASFIGMLLVVIMVPQVHEVIGEFFINLFTPRLSLIPPNWDPKDASVLNTLLGYSGATGGFWGLMYSFWIRDKGVGLSKYCGRVTSPITGKLETVPAVGFAFEATEENIKKYKSWSKYLWYDVGFSIIWMAATTLLAVLLSYAILWPQKLYPTGWKLVVVQAEWLGTLFGDIGRSAMWFLGFIFLIDTWLVAQDHFARMIASNLQSNIPSTRKWTYRRIYYIVFFIYCIISSITIFLAMPGTLILMTGVGNQIIMIIYSFAFLYLHWFYLPKIHPAGKNIRPNWISFIGVIIAAIVWIYALQYLF